MINTDEGLKITAEQLAQMSRVLVSLCAEQLPANRQWIAIMSEGPRDRIQSLLDEINQYMDTWPKVEDETGAEPAETNAA